MEWPSQRHLFKFSLPKLGGVFALLYTCKSEFILYIKVNIIIYIKLQINP